MLRLVQSVNDNCVDGNGLVASKSSYFYYAKIRHSDVFPKELVPHMKMAI